MRTIVFMHTVQEGAASKSFGLQVAQLAGVPKPVIQRAKQRLAELEKQQAPSAINIEQQPFEQLSFVENTHPVLESLSSIDVNDLTPKQALDLLFEFKSKI